MRTLRRVPDPEAAGEAWSLVFACPGGPGGFVRVVCWPDHAWFWGYLVSPAEGLVVVRDHDVAPPHGRSPVLRADGLWCELTEETPGEHWSVGLEAFGVRLDDPLDAEHGERGERLPVGLDVEWETGAGAYGSVHGVLLVGAARLDVDGTGVFEHSSFTGNPWVGAWRRVTWQRDATHGGDRGRRRGGRRRGRRPAAGRGAGRRGGVHGDRDRGGAGDEPGGARPARRAGRLGLARVVSG